MEVDGSWGRWIFVVDCSSSMDTGRIGIRMVVIDCFQQAIRGVEWPFIVCTLVVEVEKV
jgi:hypothetical protein